VATPRKYRPIFFVRCNAAVAFLVQREEHVSEAVPAGSVHLQWKSTVLAQTQIARILSTARGEYLIAPNGTRLFSPRLGLRYDRAWKETNF